MSDKRRTSLDQESGQAIFDLRDIHASSPRQIPHAKTGDQPIQSRKSQDSRKTVSAGERPLKKWGATIFFSQRESGL
jgi:hypothetical protein